MAGPGPGAARWNFDLEGFVTGDWLGALIAAGVGIAVMLAFSAAILGIDPTPRIHVAGFIHQMLAMLILMVGGAVKILTDTSAGSDAGNSAAGISVMPLLASVAGFGTMGLLMTRRLKRSSTSAGQFVQQAIRLLVIVTLLLVIVCVAARSGNTVDSSDYVRIRGPYSVFFGSCVTLLTLVITFFFGFGETLSGRVSVWRDRLVGPALGIVTLVAVTFVGATIYAVIQILVRPHHLSSMTQLGLITDATGRKSELDGLLAFGLNHAMWLLTWGMGIPLRLAFGHHHQRIGLTSFTDHDGYYWFLPVLIGVAWLIAAGVATLYSNNPAEGRRNGYRLPLLAPVLTTAIFVIGGIAVQPFGAGPAFRFHIYAWLGLGVGLVWSAAAGVVAPPLVMALPRNVVYPIHQALVRRFGAPS